LKAGDLLGLLVFFLHIAVLGVASVRGTSALKTVQLYAIAPGVLAEQTRENVLAPVWKSLQPSLAQLPQFAQNSGDIQAG
jgi:hypothetical protein